MTYCLESNKLVRLSNFNAWKKRTDLKLIENEVMGFIEGSTIQPPKEDILAYIKYMQGDIKARRILIESIKETLIPYVLKLESSKEIYEKLVELFSKGSTKEIISLRQKLYKLRILKEGIIPYPMEIFAIRDQLLKLGEVMSDREILTMVQNSLPKEWRGFTSSIDGREEAMTIQSLGKIEESRLKEGSRKENQAYATMSRKKGRFGKFGPQNKRRNMDKVRCFGCNELGHYKRDCP